MAVNHNILLETGTNEFEIVEFLIKTDKPYHFCINVAKVREVIRFPEIVNVPDTHEAIVGTANIRQYLIPIVDLGFWLGLRDKMVTFDKSKVIVTHFNHSNNGFLVDEVIRIHRITWSDIKDYSSITDFHMVDSVLGVVNINDRLIQLLDFESIVTEINPVTRLQATDLDLSLKDQRQKYTVFMAEDSPVIRRILFQNFTKAGYMVEIFENGSKLLKRMQSQKPDLVITDLEMPVMSGDYVVRKIRETFKQDQLPIIVFSSMASEENERKLTGIGANKFIGKPELTLLVNLVDDYLFRGKK